MRRLSQRGEGANRPGILLTGSPIYFPNDKIPSLMEESGLSVSRYADASTLAALTRIPFSYHGKGAIREIPGIIKARGLKKAFIASDPDLVKFNVTKKITDLLDADGMSYEIYSDIKPNPTIENVQSGVEAYKKSGADYMITVGGGSSMDTGKLSSTTRSSRTCGLWRASRLRKTPRSLRLPSLRPPEPPPKRR